VGFLLLNRYGSVLSIHDSHRASHVDTTVLHPTPSWTHPLGPASPIDSTISASAQVKVSPPPLRHAVSGEPENPDQRPDPTGWIKQIDFDLRYVVSSFNISLLTRGPSSLKASFYDNIAAPNSAATWTHPLGPPRPQVTSGPISSASFKSTSPPPYSATPGQPENPDKTYMDTTSPNPSLTWTHPLGVPTTSPAPGAHGSSTALHIPDQPTNPDARPLPHGWIDEFDQKYASRPKPPRIPNDVNLAAIWPGSTSTQTPRTLLRPGHTRLVPHQRVHRTPIPTHCLRVGCRSIIHCMSPCLDPSYIFLNRTWWVSL
jgi:hypothetical protein